MTVLLQNGNTEAVECIDKTGIVVSRQIMNSLPHFIGCLVGKGNTENVSGTDAEIIDQIGKTVCQRSCLARPCAGNHPDIPFRGSDSFDLFFI